ncbi:MAG TPA: protease modulator HflC [Planctomycetota bacterium]|nr:protease modulator HflC [Planctomycetota bacterium]HRR81985.1 protease modulator HflC [Planctomycetota bacterium]HRT97099.1 protease modulator HflC [Planctomycetota bacterium]
MKTRGKITILVALLLVATLLIFLISFQVRVNETAIVYTFRRATRTLTEPGLYWKLPYPIQTVTTYDKRTSIYEGKFQEYLTKDQHNLIVNIAVGWAIADPRMFEDKVGSRAKAEEKLGALVGGAANSIINSHDLADFVSTDPDHQYGAVEAAIHHAVQDEALAQYGLSVPFLWITQLGLPEDVTRQVFERNKEERGSKAKALRAEGDSKAETIRADADRQAKEILSKAEAEARIIRGEGDRIAAKHYEVFKQDPELANFLSSLEAIRNLRKRTTYILTTDTPPYNLLSPEVKIPGATPPAKGLDAPPKGTEK